jgi:hypothetical protein
MPTSNANFRSRGTLRKSRFSVVRAVVDPKPTFVAISRHI